jgi:tryptophanyl-tRNA synthetase
MGLDGQAKMSKSLGNTVGLLEDDEAIWQKLRPAVTDPARQRKTDPGNPDVCNIFSLHKQFSSSDTQSHVASQCRSAGWGCIDCKKVLHEGMVQELTPIRRRAAEIDADPAYLPDVLATGGARARSLAQATMAAVKDRMGLTL